MVPGVERATGTAMLALCEVESSGAEGGFCAWVTEGTGV